MALEKPQFELNHLQFATVRFKVAIIGSQTQASIQTYCENDGSILVFHEDDARTLADYDTMGFALSDLDNDAPPAVLGVWIPVADASELIAVTGDVSGLQNQTALSAPATAIVSAPWGATASGGTKTGVTVNFNLAFTLSFTSLNIDEDNSAVVNQTAWINATYKKKQPK